MSHDPMLTASVEQIRVPVDGHTIVGDLVIPRHPGGLVLFAHGSGSSRHSPRNRQVAAGLVRQNFATLLIDLLTPEEEEIDRVTSHLRFDITLLAERLVTIIDWLQRRPATKDLPVGLFGASTGGAAAIVAATMRPAEVCAVVSRGGRPDLAGDALAQLTVPTLLLVGDRDTVVVEINQSAMLKMHHHAMLELVPNATHLFEEPGALEHVAHSACDWFSRHLMMVEQR